MPVSNRRGNKAKETVVEPQLPADDQDLLGPPARGETAGDAPPEDEDEGLPPEEDDEEGTEDDPSDDEGGNPDEDEDFPQPNLRGGRRGGFEQLGYHGFNSPHPNEEDVKLTGKLANTPMATCSVDGAESWIVEKKNEYSGLREPLGKAPLNVSLPAFIKKFMPSMPRRGEETVEFCLTPQDRVGRMVGNKRPYAVYPVPWDNAVLRTLRGDDINEQNQSGNLSMQNPLVQLVVGQLANEREERKEERRRAEAMSAAAERARAEAIEHKISHATAMQGDLATAYGGVQKVQQDSFANLLLMQGQMSKEDRDQRAAREAREQEDAKLRMELDRDTRRIEMDAKLKEAELKAQVEQKRIEAEIQARKEEVAKEEQRRSEERERIREEKKAEDERRREDEKRQELARLEAAKAFEERRREDAKAAEDRRKEEKEEQRRYEDRVREDQRKHEERLREEQRKADEKAREERTEAREAQKRAEDLAREERDRQWKERLLAEEKAREDRRREDDKIREELRKNDDRIREERKAAEDRAREDRKREDDMRAQEREREREDRKREDERKERALQAEKDRDREFRLAMEKVRDDALAAQRESIKSDAAHQREHTQMMISLIEKRHEGAAASGNKLGVIGDVLDTLGMTPGDVMEKVKEFMGGDAKSIGVTVVEQIGGIAKAVLKMAGSGEEGADDDEDDEDEDTEDTAEGADEPEEAEDEGDDEEDRKRIRKLRAKRAAEKDALRAARQKEEAAAAAKVAASKQQKQIAEKVNLDGLLQGGKEKIAVEVSAPETPSAGGEETSAASPTALDAQTPVLNLAEVRAARETVEALAAKLASEPPERWPGLVMETPDPGPFINYVKRVGLDEAFDDYEVDLDALALALAPLFGGTTPRGGV